MPRSRHSEAPSDVSEHSGSRLTFKHPDGRPVKFFIDSLSTKFPSIPNVPHPRFSVEQAAKYERFIRKYGGERVASKDREHADVLLVGEAMKDAYARWFAFNPRPIVVTPKFLKRCLQTGRYKHTVPTKKGMGGRPPGRAAKKWTPFTPEETMMLCKYISHRVPEAGAGGRSGNRIYRELEQHALEYPEGPWALAKNHPWDSWREHYVKKKHELDPIINDMAKEANITSESQGTYAFDRRRVAYRRVQEREIESEEEDAEEGDAEEVAGGHESSAPHALRRARNSNDDGEPDPEVEERVDEPDMAPARKRRRTNDNRRREESEGEAWGLEPTLNDPSAPSNDARPGPEDAGPSMTQRSPSSGRSSSPAQPPKPRPKARSMRAATPLNTQQTLVDPNSPIKNGRRRQRTGERSVSEDSPEPSQRLSPARAPARQTRSGSQAVTQPQERINDRPETLTGRSAPTVEDEIEAMLSDPASYMEDSAQNADVEEVDDGAPEGEEVPAVREGVEEEENNEEEGSQLPHEDDEADSHVESDDGRAAESLEVQYGDDENPFATYGSGEDDEDDDDD